MRTRTKIAVASVLLAGGMVVNGGVPAIAASPTSDHARACATPAAAHASCGAIQLVDPAHNWHPGHGVGPAGKPGGGSGSVSLPSSGYYPGDLQSAYGLGAAIGATSPGPSAPTIAVVDAYDDPYAASNLAAYRSAMSGATSPTGLTGSTIPPLCGNGITSGCVTFTKVNQSGGTSYPKGNTGWAEEISLDLDMASAICPDCNVVLVEASSSSFSNLEAAVSYAKTLIPAVITNSYGGSEFSGETSYNSVYSSTTKTGITVSSGDNGYGVEFPAASPGVTAVGGTSLTYDGNGNWSQTVWSGAGAGCSAYEGQSSWQSPYSLSADCTNRQVADISAVADPNTGVAVYDTYGEPGWMVFGGTSASAQIIGAMYALAASGATVNTSSSALYTSPTGSLVPVTSGSDGSCGNYLCDAADSISANGYTYSGPAGLGTPLGVGAFTGSATAPPPATPTISLSASPTSATVTAGGSTSYTLTVTASGGFGGTVDLSQTGCPANECTLASTVDVPTNGSVTTDLTVNTASTDSGKDTIQVTATAATSSATSASTSVTLNVNPVTSTSSTMNVLVAASTATKKGPNWHVPITVTATDATSGVDLSGAGVTLGIYPNTNCSGSAQSTATGSTGTNGSVTFNFSTRQSGSWCAQATVTDTNYTTGTGLTQFNT